MRRIDFLKTVVAGALALAAEGITAACSSPAAATNPSDSKTFNSSTSSSHYHTITIQKTEVDTPPATGINRPTSSASGHSHSFVMAQAELQTVLGGGSVVVTTGEASGHTHDFTIQKWY